MWAQTTDPREEEIGWDGGTGEERLARAETILLVEDETFVREVTAEVLRSAGYEVLTAKNAADAVRVYDARRGAIDLLLTDVVLPGETGRALSRRLRRKNPGLKILLVTGYAEQLGLLEAEPEEFLAKPFSTEVLLRRVRQLLEGARLPVETINLVTHACSIA
jgi:two-component system cell cycle sensor histidine kinase/response regulator CckA